MCLMGHVPATLFKLGTLKQVRAYVKKLIGVCGGEGHLPGGDITVVPPGALHAREFALEGQT